MVYLIQHHILMQYDIPHRHSSINNTGIILYSLSYVLYTESQASYVVMFYPSSDITLRIVILYPLLDPSILYLNFMIAILVSTRGCNAKKRIIHISTYFVPSNSIKFHLVDPHKSITNSWFPCSHSFFYMFYCPKYRELLDCKLLYITFY